MILGILSDTHAAAAIARDAVALLTEAGAEYLIHCGDVGDEAVLDALAGIPSAFVFGNCDYDRTRLIRYADLIGVRCLGAGGVLELGGKKIAVTHGDDPGMTARYRRPAAGVDYLLTGHTHVQHDYRSDGVRCINPGALFRASVKTVTTLDLETDTLREIIVPAPRGR